MSTAKLLFRQGKTAEAWAIVIHDCQQKKDPAILKEYLPCLEQWGSTLGPAEQAALQQIVEEVGKKSGLSDDEKFTILFCKAGVKSYANLIPLLSGLWRLDDFQDRVEAVIGKLYDADKDEFNAMIGRWEAEWKAMHPTPALLDRVAAEYRALGGVFVDELKDYDRAISFYKASCDCLPDNPNGWAGCAFVYEQQEEFGKAIEAIEKQLALDGTDEEKGVLEQDMAQQYDNWGKYQTAIEHYDKALTFSPDLVICEHNKAIIYDLWGDRGRAQTAWKATIAKWDELIKVKNFEDDANQFYYFADALFWLYDIDGVPVFSRIEELYRDYEKKCPTSEDVYVALIRLFVEERRAIREKEWTPADPQVNLETIQASLNEAFRKGVAAYKAKLADKPSGPQNKAALTSLGDIYLTMGFYDDALTHYQQVLQLDPSDSRILEGVGVCQFKLGKYTDSIGPFKKVLEFTPDDLNIQSNLADAYRKAGTMESAFDMYQRVLDRSPSYQDAVIGLGEYYKSLGDQALEKKDKGEAEEQFGAARKQFEKVATGQLTTIGRMTGGQRSALDYSLGYTLVRLFEVNSDTQLLKNAKTIFGRIPAGSAEYFKAEKAIRSINEKMDWKTKIRSSLENIVLWIALFLFGATQLVFVGTHWRLLNHDDVYKLNRASVHSYLSAHLAPAEAAAVQKKLAPYLSLGLPSLAQWEGKLDSLLPDSVATPLISTLDGLVTVRSVAGEGMGATTYSFMTFGSLVFIIVGLFLPSVTVLKVVGVELDKNAVDTVKTSASFLVS